MSSPQESAASILKKIGGVKPRAALILGSGLGALADQLMENPTIIAYQDIPGFPQTTVQGHHGEMWFGDIQGVPVVCLRGRFHYYESGEFTKVTHFIRTLKALGCEQLLMTNAAGSMHVDRPPGDIMLMTDHINFMGSNPLIGPNDNDIGDRFFSVNDIYNKTMREVFVNVAKEKHIKLHQGVYVAVTGPNYETPAEIRMFKQWGGDAVGMSTVPEALLAQHCGMKVGVLSQITNLAAGLSETPPSHEEVLLCAKEAAVKMVALFQGYFEAL